MRVQIVHDEDDLLRFRSVVNQPLYFFSPIYCGSVFSDTLVMPTGKRFNKSEDTACSISHIFRIYLFLFSTLIAVNGRKSLKINKVTLCIWIFGWRKLSLHHVRTQETPQIRCL